MYKTSSVFSNILKSYNTKTRFIIQQGGTRSGKTWSTLQLLLEIAIRSEDKKIITVVSRTLPNLKLGAIRDFESILESRGFIPEKIRNKQDNTYKIGKSIIEFFGADQTDKVHGPSRDILFINEANFIKYEIYLQLDQRTTETVIIDFNPSVLFWVQEELIPNEDHILLKTTYRDNEYCPVELKSRLDDKLERYNREKKQGNISKAFENWCDVYLFGNQGSLEGAIFDNWRQAEPDELDKIFKTNPTGYGLDYGFHPDPDAMSKISIDKRRKKIYVREMFYQTNNGTSDLIDLIKVFYKKNELIIAESATPRTNKDLSKHFNIKPVRKIRTVADWLREMQDYEFIIEGYNLEKEFQNYLWSDKKAGVPVDEFNHLIDGIRYYYMEVNKPNYF